MKEYETMFNIFSDIAKNTKLSLSKDRIINRAYMCTPHNKEYLSEAYDAWQLHLFNEAKLEVIAMLFKKEDKPVDKTAKYKELYKSMKILLEASQARVYTLETPLRSSQKKIANLQGQLDIMTKRAADSKAACAIHEMTIGRNFRTIATLKAERDRVINKKKELATKLIQSRSKADDLYVENQDLKQTVVSLYEQHRIMKKEIDACHYTF